MSKTITMSAKKEFATKCSKLFCFCTLNKMTSTWSKKKKAFASFIKCTRNVSGWMESKISIVHHDLALPFVCLHSNILHSLFDQSTFLFSVKDSKKSKKAIVWNEHCQEGVWTSWALSIKYGKIGFCLATKWIQIRNLSFPCGCLLRESYLFPYSLTM